MSTWTEERRTCLEQMWQAGHSASAIAEALNDISITAGHVSRNAVIGRAHRTGLVQHFKPVHRPRPPREPRPAPTPRPRLIIQRARPRPPAPIKPAPVIVIAAEIVPRNLPLIELTEHACRWPIGYPREPGFCFCGADTAAGVYCAGHMRLAYTPRR